MLQQTQSYCLLAFASGVRLLANPNLDSPRRCIVARTAATVCCSCRHHERRRRSLRCFAAPSPSTSRGRRQDSSITATLKKWSRVNPVQAWWWWCVCVRHGLYLCGSPKRLERIIERPTRAALSEACTESSLPARSSSRMWPKMLHVHVHQLAIATGSCGGARKAGHRNRVRGVAATTRTPSPSSTAQLATGCGTVRSHSA